MMIAHDDKELAGLRREHAEAVKRFAAVEAELARHLERLDGARRAGSASEVPGLLRAARNTEREAGALYDLADAARRNWLSKRAAQLEQELHAAALPILVRLARLRQAAGGAGLSAEVIIRNAAAHLVAQPRPAPPADDDLDMLEPPSSPALKRAELEL